MGTVIRIPTWRCSCGYSQDFDPKQNERYGFFIPANTCPSCNTPDTLAPEANDARKILVTIADAVEITASVDARTDLKAGEKGAEMARLLAQRVEDLAKFSK